MFIIIHISLINVAKIPGESYEILGNVRKNQNSIRNFEEPFKEKM